MRPLNKWDNYRERNGTRVTVTACATCCTRAYARVTHAAAAVRVSLSVYGSSALFFNEAIYLSNNRVYAPGICPVFPSAYFIYASLSASLLIYLYLLSIQKRFTHKSFEWERLLVTLYFDFLLWIYKVWIIFFSHRKYVIVILIIIL
jgi:hypothetical protein